MSKAWEKQKGFFEAGLVHMCCVCAKWCYMYYCLFSTLLCFPCVWLQFISTKFFRHLCRDRKQKKTSWIYRRGSWFGTCKALFDCQSNRKSLLKGANLHVTIPHAWLKMETIGWPWPIGVSGPPPDESWPDQADVVASADKDVWVGTLWRLCDVINDILKSLM